ncbi:MAG: hypothetical protein HKP55_15030 [Gammaproteobacteria bacterium]|nr:hypothetical protein [Gammaproteobacteria bacterium]NNJ92988.1 hypothetical protein [Gammaproteobacteria bacterium]
MQVAAMQACFERADLLGVVAVRQFIFFSVLMMFSGFSLAQTYWLNLAGASYPVPNLETCEKSQIEYSKMNAVHFISCDEYIAKTCL